MLINGDFITRTFNGQFKIYVVGIVFNKSNSNIIGRYAFAKPYRIYTVVVYDNICSVAPVEYVCVVAFAAFKVIVASAANQYIVASSSI